MHTLYTRGSYMEAWVIFILGPAIMEFRKQEGDTATFEVVLHNFFRQVECWKYDFASLPQHTQLFSDPGIPREEANDVYATMSKVFKEVFPEQMRADREEAANFLEDVTRDVYNEVVCGKPGKPGAKENLARFFDKLYTAFSGPHHAPLDCIEA